VTSHIMQITSRLLSATSPGYFPRALCTAGDFETDDCGSRAEAAEKFDRHLLTVAAAELCAGTVRRMTVYHEYAAAQLLLAVT
jgi:hypothetical protein